MRKHITQDCFLKRVVNDSRMIRIGIQHYDDNRFNVKYQPEGRRCKCDGEPAIPGFFYGERQSENTRYKQQDIENGVTPEYI